MIDEPNRPNRGLDRDVWQSWPSEPPMSWLALINDRAELARELAKLGGRNSAVCPQCSTIYIPLTGPPTEPPS